MVVGFQSIADSKDNRFVQQIIGVYQANGGSVRE